jgi:lactate dehydrogenase-like 2-hydroxyacid dehydrogenase
MARILVATASLSDCLDALGTHELVAGAPGSDADAEVLICDPTQVVDLAAIQRMPALRLIAVAGTGSDAIDHDAARSRDIITTTAGNVLAETTADIAFGLIISASRLMHDAEATLRSGSWRGWQFVENFGQDVHGATLGLVGFGAIGQAVARRAQGFQMTILHHTRHPTGHDGWIKDLDELLRESDVVSLHVPLHSETLHLLDRRRIGMLKPTAVLVNTSRGAVVDERALADALSAGQLFAAGLDVYESEPDVSARLLRAPRTVLLPHIGSATRKTREAMLRSAAEKVAVFLERREAAS